MYIYHIFSTHFHSAYFPLYESVPSENVIRTKTFDLSHFSLPYFSYSKKRRPLNSEVNLFLRILTRFCVFHISTELMIYALVADSSRSSCGRTTLLSYFCRQAVMLTLLSSVYDG